MAPAIVLLGSAPQSFPTVWRLLLIFIFSPQSPAFAASVSTSNIGVFIPSTVTDGTCTRLGFVIVVPTPVVLGFPEVPSST